MSSRCVFYLTTPSPRARSVISSELERCDLAPSEPYVGVLAVRFQPDKFEQLSAQLAAELDPEDLQKTRCRLVSDDSAPTAAELMQTQSLGNFLSWLRHQWLKHLIRE